MRDNGNIKDFDKVITLDNSEITKYNEAVKTKTDSYSDLEIVLLKTVEAQQQEIERLSKRVDEWMGFAKNPTLMIIQRDESIAILQQEIDLLNSNGREYNSHQRLQN